MTAKSDGVNTAKNRVVRAYSSLSVPGPARALNEDFVLADESQLLFGVADGFGGVGTGDLASHTVLSDIQQFVSHGRGDSEVTLPFVYRSYLSASANLLFNSFLFANDRLCDQNKTKPIHARAGASVAAVLFQGSHVTLASVGMCAAYLIRGSRIVSLLQPRSYNHVRNTFSGLWNPRWAFPLSATGMAKDLEPEICELRVQPSDVILMATDGVYGTLQEEEISQQYSVVVDSLGTQDLLDEKILKQNQELIEMANQRGNEDNQSLVAVACASFDTFAAETL